MFENYFKYGGEVEVEKPPTFQELREENHKQYEKFSEEYNMYKFWVSQGKTQFKNKMRKARKEMAYYKELAFKSMDEKLPEIFADEHRHVNFKYTTEMDGFWQPFQTDMIDAITRSMAIPRKNFRSKLPANVDDLIGMDFACTIDPANIAEVDTREKDDTPKGDDYDKEDY